MNKKGFIFSFLFLFSCFFFIGNVKAYFTYNGVTYDENKITELARTAFNNPSFEPKNYYVQCNYYKTANPSYVFDCYFMEHPYTTMTKYSSTSYFNNYYVYGQTGNSQTTGALKYRYSFSYSLSSGGWYSIKTSTGYANGFSSSWDGNIYTNFDYTRDGTLISSKLNFSSDFNVYFHLNGGQVMDMSDILNPNFIELDYQITTNNNDFHNYMTIITPMKSYSTFIGWYYDSEFTQPYNSSDTYNSDIHLYAKFRSDIYNTNNIDYIEFKFDDFPLNDTNINYNFNFKSVTYDGHDETVDFPQPFGREFYTGCDDEGQNCTVDIKYKDKLFYDLGYISYSYEFEDNILFNSSPDHITNSYSVIVPLENSMGSYLYLKLNSNYDYDIIIHYKDDEGSNNSFIRTVDITGKYGAIFLPLYDDSVYADEDSYYLTNFHIVGNVDVQVTDSRDLDNYNILQLYSMNYCNNVYSEQIDIPYNCDHMNGLFTFKIDNLTAKQTLRFVNHSYTELSDRRTIIEYDSRYFNYGILDSPNSSVQIEDPTTHEIETVGLSEFYNHFNSDNISNSKFSFKTAFNRFLYPIKFIFRYVSKLYNNYLNSSLQHYFFLVFRLVIILLIVRVII